MTAVLLEVEVIEGAKVRSVIKDFEDENGMESRLAHGAKVAQEAEEKKRNTIADFE